MKILHVTSSLNANTGGVAQAIKTLAHEFTQLSVYNEIVAVADSESDAVDKGLPTCHCLGPVNNVWGYNAKLLPWLKINLPRFDAVVVNGLWLHHSYAVWKAIKTLKTKKTSEGVPKMLVMSHGMLDPYFQYARGRKLKAIRNILYWQLIENKVINDADALLFTSETELTLAQQTFKPYHPKKQHNVGFGIAPPPLYGDDMSIAFNACCPDLKGQPYLLFLGRIDVKKGVDLLINAYIDLHKASTTANKKIFKLVIAGPVSSAGFSSDLQKQLQQETGFCSDIHFTGMLMGDAKWGAFYGCEAFVLPSHQENFGISVVEALACGKPVLISDQVNIWPEVDSGGIVEADTQEGTELLLKKWMLLSVDEKKKMALSANSIYQQRFQSLPVAKKIMNIVYNLINGLS